MNLIYHICDYIYVLNKGEVISEGSAELVFSDEKKILDAGLELPWLVKLHKNVDLPLFKTEEELYNFWKDTKKLVNH